MKRRGKDKRQAQKVSWVDGEVSQKRLLKQERVRLGTFKRPTRAPKLFFRGR